MRAGRDERNTRRNGIGGFGGMQAKAMGTSDSATNAEEAKRFSSFGEV
jgi:hypothetical protein